MDGLNISEHSPCHTCESRYPESIGIIDSSLRRNDNMRTEMTIQENIKLKIKEYSNGKIYK